MFNKLIFLLLIFIIPNSFYGQNWVSIQNGANWHVRTFFSDTTNNILYVTGNFSKVDTLLVSGVATWDGLKWDTLAGSDNMGIRLITNYSGALIASTGNVIRKWNGTNWDTIGLLNGSVNHFLNYNNKLYVSGNFDSVNGVLASRIAIYDGFSWSNINDSIWDNGTNIISSIFYKGELYIGGNFTSLDGTIDKLASWDGSKWIQIGNGVVGGMSAVGSFAIYNNELYVGGYFTKAEGNPGNYIFKWDGVNLSEVGGGLGGTNGQVFDLEVYNNELYAVGVFISAGGVPAEYFAKWNGIEWCGIGDDFNSTIGSLGVFDGDLYIGGGFLTINSDTLNYIAKWIGGSFTDTCGVISYIDENNIKLDDHVYLFPNPFTKSTVVQIPKQFISKTTSLVIFDIYGREVKRMDNITSTTLTLYKENLKSGLYIYRVFADEGILATGKLIIQ